MGHPPLKYFVTMYRIVFFIPLLVLTSCVSKKQLLEAQYLQQQCAQRERQLMSQLEFARVQIGSLQSKSEALSNEIGSLRNDKQELEQDTTRLQSRFRDMSRRAQMTQAGLGAELEAKTQELEEKRQRLGEIKTTVERRDQRLREALSQLQDSLHTLTSANADVKAELREGRIFLSLPDPLVFNPRSPAAVSPAGDKALGRIAPVFNRFPDLDILVLGHTSNDRPARGIDDNWDLSARRAVAVVRVLTRQHEVSPNQITAAGKGEYLPLTANDSAENRLKNRRLELVIAPRLDQLYNLLVK